MPHKNKNLEKVWFCEARHLEEIVAGDLEKDVDRELWSVRRKNKERMKTVSVALVLCLNIGVDPPDVPRPLNGPRKQAWVEPIICSPQKSAQRIADNLQRGYEKLQPKARYKTAIDPTVECVRKLTLSLRRNAKEERVLFHFNGHGVPLPTEAGEIWVFNRAITQYIPLSLLDLHSWMGTPSVYVWDCHSAGTIVNKFSHFLNDQRRSVPPNSNVDSQVNDDTIQLGACREGQLLPQHPDLPGDLFTCTLTSPIQTSLLWYIIKTNTQSKYSLDIIDEIPGLLTDRRTPLGELNWIFTAITDTIAWNALRADSFQRLFRQDLLTASLFRSFLLAERIMIENNCEVVSQPKLPRVSAHPLWDYWEYTLDVFLNNMIQMRTPKPNVYMIGKSEFFYKTSHRHNLLLDCAPIQQQSELSNSYFFSEHLKAFEIWLKFGVDKTKPPAELPVILQVLLSQVHRVHALELLAKFVDLGAWAVTAALSVGIFPYVLKLLQSASRELRGPLAFIWAKILWVDPVCQHELVKDNGYFYFIQILNDSLSTPRMKIVPAFVMATIIHNKYRPAQEKLIQSDYMTLCMELLLNPEVIKCKLLCQWLLIGLGRLWMEYNKARWLAVRNNAYERAQEFLTDEVPEVRAAAVFALGCFVRNRSVNNEHATTIDNEVCDKICGHCTYDGSVLVRAELAVAIQWYIVDFQARFAELCSELHKSTFENEDIRIVPTTDENQVPANGPKPVAQFGKYTVVISDQILERMVADIAVLERKQFMDPFERMWLALLRLSFDPFPYVSTMARRLINHIRDLARVDRITKMKKLSESQSHSPGSSRKSDGVVSSNDRNAHVKFVVGSPLSARDYGSETSSKIRQSASINNMLAMGLLQTPMTTYTPKRNIYGSQSGRYAKINDELIDKPVEALVSTQFVEWCSKSFQQPIFNTIYGEVSTSTRNSQVDSSCPFTQAKPTDWALHTNEGLLQKAHADVESFKNEKIKCETQHFNISVERKVTSLAWSVLRPYLITCDGETVSLFNIDKEQTTDYSLKSQFRASDEPILQDVVSDMMVANGLTHELILTGTRNGVLKVWDPNFYEHGHKIREGTRTKLVTAAYLLSDQARVTAKDRNSRFVNQTFYKWDQTCGRVVCSGNVRICRIWDAWSEKCCRDIVFRSKNPFVTSLAADLRSDLICTGFKDGTVTVFDARLPSDECEIMKLRDFTSPILGIAVAPEKSRIVVGAADGDFRVWEPRMYHEPVVEFNVSKTYVAPPQTTVEKITTRFSTASLRQTPPNSNAYNTQKVHAIDIQSNGQLISCAIGDMVQMFDVCGKKCMSQFKYTTQPNTSPSSMKFHADKVMIGLANSENHLLVYGVPTF
ncbi:WD-REPEATS-REGION domain-containing protein [Aphelenchoides besseyi]|nr:WD-REPEATS-REGION domain-containing protein [Aphelenchoides besseyi]